MLACVAAPSCPQESPFFDSDRGRLACIASNPCRSKDLHIKQSLLSSKASPTIRARRQVSALVSLQTQGQALYPKCNPEQSSPFQSSALPDRWVEDSVFDIVRNIKEAPFVHLLFDSKDNKTRTERQRVPKGDLDASERWKAMKDCVTSASPDGVILVRHLDEKAVGWCWMADFSEDLAKSSPGSGGEDESSNSTDMWGVLVLGKSVARSACYILKTTSVASTFGTCTRFCLTKAKCFGPSWHDQMQSSWLVGKDYQNCG